MIRRFHKAQLTTYQIRPRTPKEVKFNLFRRVNTGGLTLNWQEVRHALHAGYSRKLLRGITEDPRFKRLVPGKNKRMRHQELVLRFFTFRFFDISTPNLKFGSLLDQAIGKIDEGKEPLCDGLETSLFEALNTVWNIFGPYGFSKDPFKKDKRYQRVNSGLFETWTVCLSRLSNEQRLQLKRRKYGTVVFQRNWRKHLFGILCRNGFVHS